MDCEMDYLDGLPKKLPWKKVEKILPLGCLFWSIHRDLPSCVHFVFITAAHMVISKLGS